MRSGMRATRARWALVACVLWLGGVELLPALHEGLHARLAPHRHDAGSIVVASFEDTTHRHPDGSIHFVMPRAGKPSGKRTAHAPRDGRVRWAAAPEGHQAAGLAHHGAALAPVAPPITRPLPCTRQVTLLVAERDAAWRAIDPLATTARGPPRVALS